MDEPTQTPDMIAKDAYLRIAADFENYKRAMETQIADVAKFGASRVIVEMLDVMDHLDKAISHAPPDAPPEWLKGLGQVEHHFHDTMKKLGVQRIDTTNKPFDPATMEAVTVAEGGASQQVASEVRAGYILHERVIRPARVIIYQ